MIDIEEIHEAINPLPAMLSAKGKKQPTVSFVLEANASHAISMSWVKFDANNNWDREYETFVGGTFEAVLARAAAFIDELPSAEQAKLFSFMEKLGNVIDAGRDNGIAVDFLNPLTETMKRLSENVITHQPATQRIICCNCDSDCTARHFLCGVQTDVSWCPNCFALTACNAGVHGDGCSTLVMRDDAPKVTVANASVTACFGSGA